MVLEKAIEIPVDNQPGFQFQQNAKVLTQIKRKNLK